MDYQKLLAYFQAKQPEMLDVIKLLVTHETPSGDKPRLDAFAALLAERLRDAGAQVELIPNERTGMHVRAAFDNRPADNRPADTRPALILCHYDTVWAVGALETHPFRIDEKGWAYGPGIFDMQTSLALSEYAVRAIQDLALTLPRPVTILMTSDEETGSHTSRQLIEDEAAKAEYALVLESPLPNGVVKIARKGGGHFELHVTGKAAHAGVEPEKGISAIQELAHQILTLHSLTDMEKGTTVNVGVVSAGTRSNVVAAEAHAIIDVRAWTQAEADRLANAIRALQPVTPGAKLEITGGWNRPPLERDATEELFGRAREIGANLGLALEGDGTGGGSDGNFTGALGIPTLDGLGVPGHGAHADHEHIETDKIQTSAALLVALLMEL
ncbi:MAG: M20 family metallopeptidase [Caldilineaceae bacterium]|nr:M20 family metallopeptidase [Caldilineaceae bacterium]MCB9155651.1 M20 family metallopeptidase [Caldilineaceae bacterium]